MFSNWVSFLVYPNLFEIKDTVVDVVVVVVSVHIFVKIESAFCNVFIYFSFFR
jgi:hypothetical protein